MSEGESARLVAWARELRSAHDRLREALRIAHEQVTHDGSVATRDLLLYCHGFCVALGAHHRGEDAGLFPVLTARHPELAPVIAELAHDHRMVSHLLAGLENAVRMSASPAELRLHLDGLAAIMESHFWYEERALLGVLATLDLDADPAAVLGPL